MAAAAPESPPRHSPEHAEFPELDRLSRREATEALLARMADADGEERRVLEDQLVEVNLQIALDVARRYRSRGVAVEDLEQVASLGLVKAARGKDAERRPTS